MVNAAKQNEAQAAFSRQLLLRLRHDSLPATARRAILPLQLPRIAVDADPFAVLQDEARNRPVGVDRRLCNGMNESEGQEPQ